MKSAVATLAHPFNGALHLMESPDLLFIISFL